MESSSNPTERLRRDANAFYYITLASNIALGVTVTFFIGALSMIAFAAIHPNQLTDARFNPATGVWPIISPTAARTYAIDGMISLIPTLVLKITAQFAKRRMSHDAEEFD